MAKKSKKSSSLSDGEKVGIGVALTTAAVAAAGAYFLYGSPNASKNRKTVKSWALKAKGEVLEVLEKAGNLTAEEYQATVEKVLAGYSQLNTISKTELADFRKEMLENWQKIAKGTKGAKKTTKKSAKKTAKKVSKAAKKTATTK
ncbi:MAG: hypothetical protein WDZ56_01705 [Candidatus Paceibacterota bacterium]